MPTNKVATAPTTAAVNAANATAVVGGAVLGLAGVGAKVWLLLFDAVADVAAAIVVGGAMVGLVVVGAKVLGAVAVVANATTVASVAVVVVAIVVGGALVGVAGLVLKC